MAVIAGNWKMHMGPVRTRAFFDALTLEGVDTAHEIIVFPPAVSLDAAAHSQGDHEGRIGLGAQNIHWEDEGAFTGELSAPMAVEAGAAFALIGHSERRHVFGETDAETARKVEASARAGLTPVLCVGETIEERRAGRLDEVVLRQLDAALARLTQSGTRFMVAYEPVWAIGTGETATPDDASAAHATLRGRLDEVMGGDASLRIPLLYGGSVKPGNAGELMAASNVDGVLVGGASLDPESFGAIAQAAGSIGR